jgi:Rieske 2Fe-2S family protein
MWDVTTVQDKKITEDNADGIASRAYRPGPYTPLESQTAFFIETYLSQMRALITGERRDEDEAWTAPSQLYASPQAARKTRKFGQAAS